MIFFSIIGIIYMVHCTYIDTYTKPQSKLTSFKLDPISEADIFSPVKHDIFVKINDAILTWKKKPFFLV